MTHPWLDPDARRDALVCEDGAMTPSEMRAASLADDEIDEDMAREQERADRAYLARGWR